MKARRCIGYVVIKKGFFYDYMDNSFTVLPKVPYIYPNVKLHEAKKDAKNIGAEVVAVITEEFEDL